MFYKNERMAVFIDGANLYASAKLLGIEIDFKLLRSEFMQRSRLLRMYYYLSVLEDDEYQSTRPLLDWLGYNGYYVVSKPAKTYLDQFGNRKIKGSMSVELTVDALCLATQIDHAVIFSGDGNFSPLVEGLKKHGVRVSVVSTIRSNPPMTSDELRRAADNFIELEDLRTVIGKPRQERD